MRVSNETLRAAFLSALDSAQRRLVDTQAQVASGKRVNNPSDDPLAAARIARFSAALGPADAWAVVTTDRDPAYEALVAEGVPEREAFNFAMNQPIPAGANIAELAKVVEAAKGLTREALQRAVAASADPDFSADAYLGEVAITDTSELEPLVDAVIAANPGQVEAYRGGKEGLLGFFVGQVMKETKGQADARAVNELVRAKLSA